MVTGKSNSHSKVVPTAHLCGGLSPRGRGNLRRSPLPAFQEAIPAGRGNRSFRWPGTLRTRSIPAWAGEPLAIWVWQRPPRVYPRVGGGTALGMAEAAKGLSPRGRGNLLSLGRGASLNRSIPAWAGEPLSRKGRLETYSVYPRVGGGTPISPIPTRLEYRRSQL